MEERGLAASAMDRRLSTTCGFYHFEVISVVPPDFGLRTARETVTHGQGRLLGGLRGRRVGEDSLAIVTCMGPRLHVAEEDQPACLAIQLCERQMHGGNDVGPVDVVPLHTGEFARV